MSKAFPKITGVGCGRLQFHHKFIRDIWLAYEKNKPEIINGFSVRTYPLRIRSKSYGELTIITPSDAITK